MYCGSGICDFVVIVFVLDVVVVVVYVVVALDVAVTKDYLNTREI